MRIKKLQLKNGYKRFFDLTIDLGDNPRRIVALVGPNGCGKSSVLDGLLFHANAHGPIGNKGQKDYEYHSMTGAPNYNWTNVSIDFVEGNYQTIRADKEKTGKEKTIFSFRSPYRYNSKLKVNQSVSVPDIRLNDYGASAACDLDDKIEQNYRRLYVKYNKYMHDNDYTPSHTKQLIIGELNSSIKACLDLEISSIGSIEDSKGTLYFKKNGHPKEFDFNVLSSGEKEVVDILLDLYLRRDEFDDTVFLLDEPELHLHASSEIELINGIKNAIGERGQLIFATHSINIISHLSYEEIFMVKNGSIKHPSRSTIGDSLIELMKLDERIEKLSEFLSSIATWTYVNFMTECFSNPEVIQSARPDDPQIVSFKKANFRR